MRTKGRLESHSQFERRCEKSKARKERFKQEREKSEEDKKELKKQEALNRRNNRRVYENEVD